MLTVSSRSGGQYSAIIVAYTTSMTNRADATRGCNHKAFGASCQRKVIHQSVWSARDTMSLPLAREGFLKVLVVWQGGFTGRTFPGPEWSSKRGFTGSTPEQRITKYQKESIVTGCVLRSVQHTTFGVERYRQGDTVPR